MRTGQLPLQGKLGSIWLSLSRRKAKDYFSFHGWGSECHSGLLADTDGSCSRLPVLRQKSESSVCVRGAIGHQNVSLIPTYLSVVKLQIKRQTLFPPWHCRKTSVLWLHTENAKGFYGGSCDPFSDISSSHSHETRALAFCKVKTPRRRVSP